MLLATKRNLMKMSVVCRKKEYSFVLTEHNGLRIQEEIGHGVLYFKGIFKTIFVVTVSIL